MRVLRAASEDEVIAAFLAAEIDSGRFRTYLKSALAAVGADESIVRAPRLNDPRESALRVRVLAYRGWPSSYLFLGFPRNVAWLRVSLARAELAQTQYPCWTSGGADRRVDCPKP